MGHRMRVESYGDCLASGKYAVHARFSHSVHFVAGQHLVSLVDPSVGKGPNHIVAAGLNFSSVHRIRITGHAVCIGENACTRKSVSEYCSRLGAHDYDLGKIRQGIGRLQRHVYERAGENSFPDLIHRTGDSATSRVHRALSEQLASGRQALKQGFLKSGVRLLIGAGYGLTPSGDDFVAGYCSGLHLGGGSIRRTEKPSEEHHKSRKRVNKLDLPDHAQVLLQSQVS